MGRAARLSREDEYIRPSFCCKPEFRWQAALDENNDEPAAGHTRLRLHPRSRLTHPCGRCRRARGAWFFIARPLFRLRAVRRAGRFGISLLRHFHRRSRRRQMGRWHPDSACCSRTNNTHSVPPAARPWPRARPLIDKLAIGEPGVVLATNVIYQANADPRRMVFTPYYRRSATSSPSTRRTKMQRHPDARGDRASEPRAAVRSMTRRRSASS